MKSTTERIEIINSFELLKGDRNKPIEKRLSNNSIFLYLYMVLTAVTIMFVLSAVIIAIAGMETKYNWSRASLLVLFSMNFLNTIGYGFYKKLLLNHLKSLEKSAPTTFDDQLDHELAEIVISITKPLKNNILIVSLMVIVLIGTIINMFMDNQFQYYQLFIVPTLLFYALASLNVWKTYQKLKANIDEVENSQAQHQLI